MSALRALINAVDEAKEALSTAEDARDRFLDPILVILGATGGGISRCVPSGGNLHIGRTGSHRGYRWDDDYVFPIDIFTSQDPLKAARDYTTTKASEKEEASRKEKLATIQKLQRELGGRD